MKIRLAVAFALLALLGTPSGAKDIYRWVDETGRTQLSDTVPEKYKGIATRVDSKQFDLSPEQRREVEAREKAKAAEDARRKASEPAPAAPAIAASGPAPRAASGPASAAGTECEALFRRYRESLECFAPYRNGNGTVKLEAFQFCTETANPTLKCGSEKAY